MAHSHLAEMLDLDAEVLHDYYDELHALAGTGLPDRPVIVDLGAGTGTGTIALARRFPAATVIAVDVDEEMLAAVRVKAARFGDRVRTVRADLDEDWPELGVPVHLIWASASMHHMASPADALARAYRLLSPGGRFVIAELDSFPRFLPGSPVEDLAHEEMAKMRAERGLHMHEDWAARLAEAGFEVVDHRHADIALSAPLPPAANRYAEVALDRMRHGLADRLSTEDLAALTAEIEGLAGRDDLILRTVRTAWLAQRP